MAKRVTQSERDQFIADYRQGFSVSTIAKKYKRAIPTVTKVVATVSKPKLKRRSGTASSINYVKPGSIQLIEIYKPNVFVRIWRAIRGH